MGVAASIGAMNEHSATTLSLELVYGDGPIAGRISDGTREFAFRGWLALEAARAPRLESADGDRSELSHEDQGAG